MFQPQKQLTAEQSCYAAFPDSLKEAMKTADQRHNWTAADWEIQTRLINDTLNAQPVTRDGFTFHPATDEQIAAGYRQDSSCSPGQHRVLSTESELLIGNSA